MTQVFSSFCFFFGGSLVLFLILPPALEPGTPTPLSPSLQLMAQMWTQPSLTQLSGRATDRALTQWRTSPCLSPHHLDTLRTPHSYSPRRHFLSSSAPPFPWRIFFPSIYARISPSIFSTTHMQLRFSLRYYSSHFQLDSCISFSHLVKRRKLNVLIFSCIIMFMDADDHGLGSFGLIYLLHDPSARSSSICSLCSSLSLIIAGYSCHYVLSLLCFRVTS